MRRALTILLSSLLLTVAARAADATPPEQVVHQATDRILALIKAHRDEYARDHQKLYAMVDREVLPYFDFRVMGRSVLGRAWRTASEEQREQFVKEFRDLLVRTYATALLKYTNEEIRYLPVRYSEDKKQALIRTEVVQSGGGGNIPIYYSFYQSPDGWKVYDVSIENVSLVTNYRSVYAEKVRNQGLDALIASLRDANQRGEVEKTAPGKPATGS